MLLGAINMFYHPAIKLNIPEFYPKPTCCCLSDCDHVSPIVSDNASVASMEFSMMMMKNHKKTHIDEHIGHVVECSVQPQLGEQQ